MRHDALIDAMIELFSQDAKRINHFLKVYAFAQTIALQEKVNAELQDIIEAVAICHDIGIRISEKKYGNCTYEMQQTEGPPEARKLLSQLCYPEKLIDRVCHIISLHHTLDAVEGVDFRILVEADLLVNIDEKRADAERIESMRSQAFRTKTGLRYLSALFPAPPIIPSLFAD